VTTDASGKATYTATYADPSTDDDYQSEYVWVSDYSPNLTSFGDTDHEAVWDDETPYAYEVTVSNPTEYKVVNDPAPTSNSATALVTDQYGNPISGIAVGLSSDQTDGLNGGNTVTTGSNGKATINYQWTVTTDAMETITADAGLAADGTVEFYWVHEAATGDTINPMIPTVMEYATGNILVKDLPNKSFVAVGDADFDLLVDVAGSNYLLWIWKPGDTFRINGDLVTQAAFETAFAMTEAVEIAVVSYSTTGPSEFDLHLFGDR